MNLIVAVDKNWAIGCENELLAKIPADLGHFKEITINKVVIMGRKTLASLPGGKPLPDRLNIVITKQAHYDIDGVIAVKSIQEALDVAYFFKPEDVFVIGGGAIYRQLLDSCDTAYVTKLDHVYKADTYMPNLDRRDNWHCIDVGERTVYDGLTYRFCTYEKI